MNEIIYAKVCPKILKKINQYTLETIVNEIVDNDSFIDILSYLDNFSDTNINHIIPVSYYSKWLKENKKKKKTREHSIDLEGLISDKKITLQRFMSEERIFIDELEKILINFSFNNKFINTERINYLDKINNHILNRNIKPSYFFHYKFENNLFYYKHNIEINDRKKLHENYIENIKKDIEYAHDISDIQIYFSFLKAKTDFYLLKRDKKERCLEILNLYKNNVEVFLDGINLILRKIILFFLVFYKLKEEMLLLKEIDYISNYLGIENLILNNIKLDSIRDKKMIELFLINLIKITPKINSEKNYFYALINSLFILSKENYYANKDNNLSFLILNSSKNLITGEYPLISLSDDRFNGNFYMTAYTPNTLILSANEEWLDICIKNFYENKENCFIFDFYNETIKKINDLNGFFITKK